MYINGAESFFFFSKYFIMQENILHMNIFIIILSYLELCIGVLCCLVEWKFSLPHIVKFVC
jgi:hypothetical protein